MLRSSALGAGVLAVGNVGALLGSKTALASGRGNDAGHSNPYDATDYGPLVSDPAGVLELPEGFSYRIISRADLQGMPGFYDGTGAFRGPANSIGIVRNSELATSGISTVSKVTSDYVYDPSRFGGTTTVIVDKHGDKVDEYVSLAGTERNCAGGETPWGTWLTCEETETITANARHGYVFEVDPWNNDNNRVPTPLKSLGRFPHEAAVIDPRNLDVYLSEDASGPFGLIYKAVLDAPTAAYGGLRGAGALFAMKATDVDGAHVPTLHPYTEPGTTLWTEWVPVPDPDAGTTSVRKQFTDAQVTRSQKFEGLWWDGNKAYIVCSFANGFHSGQVWSLDPGSNALRLEVRFGASLPNDEADEPDNITVSPWGGLILCEDGSGVQHLLNVNPDGTSTVFARNVLNDSEFTGACFSPDRQTLFVNIQDPGIQFAITGPWQA
jgi:secreted PhoX family phosphatase